MGLYGGTRSEMKTSERKLVHGNRKNIIKERRLRWLGHVLRMDNSRTAPQVTQWGLRGYKRQERLANAKVIARQQCVFEGP